jgi:hypothetical protein
MVAGDDVDAAAIRHTRGIMDAGVVNDRARVVPAPLAVQSVIDGVKGAFAAD